MVIGSYSIDVRELLYIAVWCRFKVGCVDPDPKGFTIRVAVAVTGILDIQP